MQWNETKQNGIDELLNEKSVKSAMYALQTSSGHQMLGVHHSAMTTVHFGKIARKHGLTGVCLDLLSRHVHC